MELEPEPQEPQLFALAEPECIPFPDLDLDLDPAQNWIHRSKKSKNKKFDDNFLRNNAASKGEDILPVPTFSLKNSAKYSVDPVPDLDPEPEPKLFQSRNQNHNTSFRFHNTGDG